MNDNKKKVFFTYKKDELGEISMGRVCIYDANSRKSHVEAFDIEKHRELFENFIDSNNIDGKILVSELEAKGLFNEEDITREKLESYIMSENAFEINEEKDNNEIDNNETDDNEFHDEDEYVDEDEDNKDEIENSEFHAEDEYVTDDTKENNTGKRILAGFLAAGAVVGTLTLLHSCNQEKIVDEAKDQTLEDLLNQMSPNQKAFFESSFKAVENFNNNATKAGNFALDKDQSTLHMSVDEAVALNIIMNDYSSEELYDIFGTVNFDTTNLMNLARSAYGKLSTYYMNAKEPSGLSSMINDMTAREFFERHENAVIEFNNNPSLELADSVIKGIYDDYTYDGANGEYNKINNDGVAWFATAPVFGYQLANRNVPEFSKTSDGLVLSELTNEILSGIDKEINIDIMDELNQKSLCASVTRKTNEKVESLKTKQNIETSLAQANAKNDLVEGLKENGNMSLANKVMSSKITDALLQEISETSSKNNKLVEEYKSKTEAFDSAEAKVMAVLNLAKATYNSKDALDISELVNNRFRSPLVLEKEPVVDTTPGVTTEEEKKEQLKEDLYVGEDKNGTPVYDGDELNELSKEDKEEFIKDNGVIVNKENDVVTEEEVKFEDLTEEEKEKVVDQEAILKEVETVKNSLIEKGVEDAIDYTEAKGTYNYNGTIILPTNGQVLDTDNMSLFNIAAYDAAFGTEGIDDNQIKEKISEADDEIDNAINLASILSDDAVEYLTNKYGSNWQEYLTDESYVYALEKQINGSLDKAEELGEQMKKEAEVETKNAKIEVEVSTDDESLDTVIPTTGSSTDTSETNTKNYPNLDTGYGAKDEIPYNPNLNVVPNTGTGDTSSEYDKNLDANFSMDDEQPYVPSISIEMPGYYVDDADLDDAFNAAITDATTKGK